MTVPRLVATDLDGTLLHSDGSLTARSRDVLRELDRRGIPVVFVTGRPLRWTMEVFDHVGELGLAIVSNGGLIWDVRAGAVRLLRALAPKPGLEVCEVIRAAVPDSWFAVETVEGIGLESGFKERHPLPADTRRGDLVEIFDRPAVKLLARHESLGPLEFWDLAAGAIGDRAVITWSSDSSLLEISAPGVTKASTLAILCEALNLAADEVIAFGDMPNDIALLEWAGASYAMANAHPTVLAAATAVAPSNDEDGVAATLARVFGL